MPLETIADLDNADANEHVLKAFKLYDAFLRFKGEEVIEGYQYTITILPPSVRSQGVHASELSCPRKLTYSILGIERQGHNADVNMQLRFELGTATHAMLQNDLERMSAWYSAKEEEITFVSEVEIDPRLGGWAEALDVHSHCDGIIHLVDEQVRVGIEIKTASGPDFERTTRPKIEHLEQACLYMACLDLPLMWFIYYNKSSSQITRSQPPFLIRFDKKLWETSLKPKILAAHDAAAAGHLLERIEGYACRWCPFAWTCKPKGYAV